MADAAKGMTGRDVGPLSESRQSQRRPPAITVAEMPRRSGSPRADGFQRRSDFATPLHQVVIGLQAKEKAVRQLEVTRKSQIGVGGYRPLAEDDLVDAAGRHADRAGQRGLRQGHRLEKILKQNFAWRRIR